MRKKRGKEGLAFTKDQNALKSCLEQPKHGLASQKNMAMFHLKFHKNVVAKMVVLDWRESFSYKVNNSWEGERW